MRFAIVTGCSLLLCGCPQDPAPAPAPPPPLVAPTGVGGPEVVRRVELDLADATLTDVVRALADATGKPVAIDPAAQELASCARITVVSPAPATADEVIGIVARALEGTALSLEQSSDGSVVRRVAGVAPPASCLPAAAQTADETAAGDRPRTGAQALADVRRVNATTFLVTRAARDGAFADQSAIAGRVRIVPHTENGAVAGLKLYGISSTSALAQLGFQNGDMLRSINGAEMSSPEQALEAYARLRNASAYEVRLDRRGTPMTFTYRVVDRLP